MKFKIILSLLLSFLCIHLPAYSQLEKYRPTHASVRTHPLPEWYKDAKFGVIIHYGLYSVPAWAPLFNPVGKLFSREFFVNNPYSEWYMNTMQIFGSPTYLYHLQKYGSDFKYNDFVKPFNAALQQWRPDDWASLFVAAGVKYVVLVTKHHDGFLLWPSQYRNPYMTNYVAARDVVGELTDSVRKRGLRMGLYYSGGYDWSYSANKDPIIDTVTALKNVLCSEEYAEYVNHHWHELIEIYRPDIIWNDVALPNKINKWQLFADYYNLVPDGVCNNRWNQSIFDLPYVIQPPDQWIDFHLSYSWFDFYSSEYLPEYRLTRHKWEADHGLGYSFGYNSQEFEHPEHFKTLDQLIEDLADLVSKNGSLLLAITPAADGTIPKLEQNLLLGIGHWLELNGDAIYATKPWNQAEGIAMSSAMTMIPVRFTQSKDENSLYVILLKNPGKKDITLANLNVSTKKIEILYGKNPIPVRWQKVDKDLKISLSQTPGYPTDHALVLKISR